MESRATLSPYLLRESDGESIWFLGNLVTIKAGGAATGGRLTVAEFLNPPGFAPPLHRHYHEEEMFYVLSGTARFRCDGKEFAAGPGDFVFLPARLAHTFIVGPDDPLRVLQVTVPSGFESFAAEAGEPARERRLPDPGPFDPAKLAETASRHGIEIIAPPPTA
jgi:mannose-6-phosphate isomerase-like protein (cupin superfamily)